MRREPALLASMTQAVTKQHGIDPPARLHRRLVGRGRDGCHRGRGLSRYFCRGRGSLGHTDWRRRQRGRGVHGDEKRRVGHSYARKGAPPWPTSVFHGDKDTTVHPRNGERVIAAVLGSTAAGPQVEQGVSAKRQRYTRHADHGRALTEHWLVRGAGHAWSGGLAEASYTDGTGPDPMREMLRFSFFNKWPDGSGPTAPYTLLRSMPRGHAVQQTAGHSATSFGLGLGQCRYFEQLLHAVHGCLGHCRVELALGLRGRLPAQ